MEILKLKTGTRSATEASLMESAHTVIYLLQFIMCKRNLDKMHAQVGDKVRLKVPRFKNRRGVIAELLENSVMVSVDGDFVEAQAEEITNLSLAARKAWKSKPNRNVGRPQGSQNCDRVSVTLRIDRELWEQFRQMEAEGVIADRTTIINSWLREKTREISNGSKD